MDAQQSLGLEDPFMLADQALDDLLLGFAGSPGMACGDYGGIALHEHAINPVLAAHTCRREQRLTSGPVRARVQAPPGQATAATRRWICCSSLRS